MPGLLRGMARTAAIAGTATAVAGGVAHRQQSRWASEQTESQSPQQAQDSSQEDVYSQLEKLGKLKDQGIINEQEFNLKKQQLLGL